MIKGGRIGLKRINKKKCMGFTLIELLLSITIASIISLSIFNLSTSISKNDAQIRREYLSNKEVETVLNFYLRFFEGINTLGLKLDFIDREEKYLFYVDSTLIVKQEKERISYLERGLKESIHDDISNLSFNYDLQILFTKINDHALSLQISDDFNHERKRVFYLLGGVN